MDLLDALRISLERDPDADEELTWDEIVEALTGETAQAVERDLEAERASEGDE